MAKTQIEKIASIEEEIKQLENKKKRLIQEKKEQERKDRTNRLCKRMGFIEKLLPGAILLTKGQFKTFVEQTIVTDHSRRIRDELTSQNAATASAQGAGTAASEHPACRPNHLDSAGGWRRRGSGTRVTDLRSEAGGDSPAPSLVGSYYSISVEVRSCVCYNGERTLCRLEEVP